MIFCSSSAQNLSDPFFFQIFHRQYSILFVSSRPKISEIFRQKFSVIYQPIHVGPSKYVRIIIASTRNRNPIIKISEFAILKKLAMQYPLLEITSGNKSRLLLFVENGHRKWQATSYTIASSSRCAPNPMTENKNASKNFMPNDVSIKARNTPKIIINAILWKSP